tara:strand:+ start:490 stop:2682 length:2193 start_codon:yes stop_codon:yes gene_type:complete
MTSKNKKKKKSVERQKTDKSIKADIIGINDKDSNQNINKQVVQIVFPSDTEIRKVKKKKKKSKSKNTQRNKLLEELKQALEQYDTIQSQVREKNITIPSDLGLTTINTSDLKTNDEIKKFIEDVVNKTNKLRELLQSSTSSQSVQPLFTGGNPFGMIQPRIIQPSPIYQQPQVVQPQTIPSVVSPIRVPPIRVPSSDDRVEKTLKEIEEETKKELEKEGKSTQGIMPPPPTVRIPSSERGSVDPNIDVPSNFNEIKIGISNISLSQPPQQRIDEAKKLLQRIEEIQNERLKNQEPLDVTFVRERNGLAIRLDSIIRQSQRDLNQQSQPSKSQPSQSSQPSQPSQPVDLNLVTEEINIGGKLQKFISPAGYSDIVKQALKYQGDIVFDVKEPLPERFNIPIDKLPNLIRERELISDEYFELKEKFSEEQLEYIDNNNSVVDKRIRQILMEEPKETLKYVYTQQQKPFKEITQGNEAFKLEIDTAEALKGGTLKDAFKNAEYKKMDKLLNETNDLFNDLNKKPTNKTEGEKLLDTVRKKKSELETQYYKIPVDIRGLLKTKYNKTDLIINKLDTSLLNFMRSGDFKKVEEIKSQRPVGYSDSNKKFSIDVIKKYINNDFEYQQFNARVKTAAQAIFGSNLVDHVSSLKTKVDKQTYLNQALAELGDKSPYEFNRDWLRLEEGMRLQQDDRSFLDADGGLDTREGFEKEKEIAEREARKKKETDELTRSHFAA